MKRVYLSYARADAQRAEELRRMLLAQGYRPWVDPRPIGEHEWRHEMDEAIRQAHALVLLLSNDSANSIFRTYECAFALGKGLPVFVIVYDEAPVHPRLLNVSRYDFRAFVDENHFWDHVVADFKRQVEQKPSSALSAPYVPVQVEEIDMSIMPEAPGFWIVVRRGPIQSAMFRLERDVVTLGRDGANDIVIADLQVSRFHLRFLHRDNEYHLEDLGSTNGTRVNGTVATGITPLENGDTLFVGDAIALSYDLIYVD